MTIDHSRYRTAKSDSTGNGVYDADSGVGEGDFPVHRGNSEILVLLDAART